MIKETKDSLYLNILGTILCNKKCMKKFKNNCFAHVIYSLFVMEILLNHV